MCRVLFPIPLTSLLISFFFFKAGKKVVGLRLNAYHNSTNTSTFYARLREGEICKMLLLKHWLGGACYEEGEQTIVFHVYSCLVC